MYQGCVLSKLDERGLCVPAKTLADGNTHRQLANPSAYSAKHATGDPAAALALLAPFQQELDEREGNAYELRRNSGGETPQTG